MAWNTKKNKRFMNHVHFHEGRQTIKIIYKETIYRNYRREK